MDRVGLTAVGDRPEDAGRLYERAVAVFREEAEAALCQRDVPDVS